MIAPLASGRRAQLECGGELGVVGKGKARAREGQTKTRGTIVKRTGRCNARPRHGKLKCGRHKLLAESSAPPEGSDVDKKVDDECFMEGSDLLGPGSTTTKCISLYRCLPHTFIYLLFAARIHCNFLTRIFVGRKRDQPGGCGGHFAMVGRLGHGRSRVNGR